MGEQSKGRSGKPLIWKVFGLQQKALRTHRGLTQEQLAALTARRYSLSTVQKMEAGSLRPQPDYVTDVDEALGAEGMLVAMLEELGKPGYPDFFQGYADTEGLVQRLYKYDTHAINGLLQTEAHARAVLSARIPLLEEDEIEFRVQGRLERQTLLTRKPSATLCFVIEEHVLRRPIGGQRVHKEQLDHLVACAKMRNISIHVVPTEVETHAGLDGPMTLLTTEEGRSVAYVEYQGGGSVFYASPKEVDALEQRYAMIRSNALRAPESMKFIEELAGAL
ncbi:helix-turn-helix domain-containing protein [Streptomyces sp. NBC_00237]|uniref:helix-turn-helix domain-containing protein n=1 Tax=Streptomyces sp. NBC_00237 TaxID=2975687 RepID=UPI002255B796|nr:helix-turn-helix transcriptional regulator [Streptomyces sp. NBC_00237]MCX5200202.1 helix-turn-helix domain-containing protein [Streptomyces sp. NBC_00237]